MKKMPRPSAAPWARPSSSIHAQALPSGAYSDAAMPAAVAATVGTTSSRCAVIRCASTGMTRAVTALPRFIRASRLPACEALMPRPRSNVGSQDSVA